MQGVQGSNAVVASGLLLPTETALMISHFLSARFFFSSISTGIGSVMDTACGGLVWTGIGNVLVSRPLVWYALPLIR